MVGCGQCNRSFVSAQALQSHCRAKGHRPPRSNSSFCGQCERWFPHPQALQQHIRDSSAHLESYCRSCDRTFVNRQSLKQHLASSPRHSRSLVVFRGPARRTVATSQSSSFVQSIYYVDCPICRKSFRAPSGIAQHIESGVCSNITRHHVTDTVHSLGIIPTISIPRRLKSRASTSLTIRTIATPQTFNGHAFICFLCRRGFRSLPSLNVHLSSAAHDPYQFRCPKCKKRVKLVSGLIQHIESGSCGIAGFQQVADLATNFMNRFTKRLTT